MLALSRTKLRYRKKKLNFQSNGKKQLSIGRTTKQKKWTL